MPDSPSDAPRPDADTDVPTDEATINAALIAVYFESLPRRPVMTTGPED